MLETSSIEVCTSCCALYLTKKDFQISGFNIQVEVREYLCNLCTEEVKESFSLHQLEFFLRFLGSIDSKCSIAWLLWMRPMSFRTWL